MSAIVEDQLPLDLHPEFLLSEGDDARGYIILTPYTFAEKFGGKQLVIHTLIAWFVAEEWTGDLTEAVCGGKFYLN